MSNEFQLIIPVDIKYILKFDFINMNVVSISSGGIADKKKFNIDFQSKIVSWTTDNIVYWQFGNHIQKQVIVAYDQWISRELLK